MQRVLTSSLLTVNVLEGNFLFLFVIFNSDCTCTFCVWTPDAFPTFTAKLPLQIKCIFYKRCVHFCPKRKVLRHELEMAQCRSWLFPFLEEKNYTRILLFYFVNLFIVNSNVMNLHKTNTKNNKRQFNIKPALWKGRGPFKFALLQGGDVWLVMKWVFFIQIFRENQQ